MTFLFTSTTASESFSQLIAFDTAKHTTSTHLTVGSDEDPQDTIAIRAAAFLNNLSEEEAARLIDSIRKTLPMNR